MNATALTWQLYADNAGFPDGNPSGSGNPPVWTLTLTPGDPHVTISEGSRFVAKRHDINVGWTADDSARNLVAGFLPDP